MRDIKRKIARHLMELHGVEQINKKKYTQRAKAGKPAADTRKKSFFALHWRDYLNPASDYRKDMERKLKREAAKKSRIEGKDVRAAWPVPRR